jgi:pimeloyl-ACP methyl ester carboxylesterase
MNRSELKLDLKHNTVLSSILQMPDEAGGLVIFAHGSGSSRLSPRNNYVAKILTEHHIATVLTDLLTASEDSKRENRFNIALLTDRLIKVTELALEQSSLQNLPVGYFGASTGAAAALQAAALVQSAVKAVVSRGGRPDLATQALQEVTAATLLIVGSLDPDVIELNKQAYTMLTCKKEMKIIEGASHLFEEPGKLHQVAQLAAEWFEQNLLVPVE